MSEYDDLWHWRDSQKIVRFFALDARAASAFVLLLVHFRIWTLLVALVVSVIFWLLERRGLHFWSALRALRSWVVGTNRPSVALSKKRRLTDFGR